MQRPPTVITVGTISRGPLFELTFLVGTVAPFSGGSIDFQLTLTRRLNDVRGSIMCRPREPVTKGRLANPVATILPPSFRHLEPRAKVLERPLAVWSPSPTIGQFNDSGPDLRMGVRQQTTSQPFSMRGWSTKSLRTNWFYFGRPWHARRCSEDVRYQTVTHRPFKFATGGGITGRPQRLPATLGRKGCRLSRLRDECKRNLLA